MTDVLGYLQSKGLHLKRAGGTEVHVACFWCGEDSAKRGRLYINVDPQADIPGLYSCKLCDAHGAFPTIQRHFGDRPEPGDREDEPSLVKREILAEAAEFYHQLLVEDISYVEVLKWLTGPERMLTMETVERQKLGYAPGGRVLYGHLRRQGYSLQDMEATGLVAEYEHQPGDSLGRPAPAVTIPYRIVDNVVGLRARAWPYDGKGPKYKTPPKNPVRLFNSDATWDAKELIITEGEFDCLVLQQLGFHNVVAFPGANVYQDTWDGYFAQTRRIYTVFDNDAAGAKGEAKLLERFGPRIKSVSLSSEGKLDPTQWVRDGGTAEQFQELLDQAKKSRLLITVDEAQEEHASLQGLAGVKFGIELLDLMIEPGLLPAQLLVVLAKTNTGKGHPLDTEVPTPEGLARWGDLRRGDRVFGSNGQPTNVVRVFDRGVLPVYKVGFSDGTSVETDLDHIWTVFFRYGRKREWTPKTMTTKELLESDLRRGIEWRYTIPIASPLDMPDRDLPVEPYTLGALLANGALKGTTAVLSTADIDVVAKVAQHYSLREIDRAERWAQSCPRYVIHDVIGSIKKLGLGVGSRDKFIPETYFLGSVSQRVALLNGLLDGDGGVRRGSQKRSANYYTTSQRLADGVVRLASSLGGTATQQWGRGDRSGDCVMSIMLPDEIAAFTSQRKSKAQDLRYKRVPRRAIVSVDYVGPKRIRCIAVDAADSLYLVGREHIVTHNTLWLLNMMHRMSVQPGQEHLKFLFISLEQTRGDWYERARRIHRFYNLDGDDRECLDHWRDRLRLVDKNRISEAEMQEILNDYEDEMGQKPDVITLDYLGYWAQGFRGDKYERVSDAVMSLKAVAKDNRIPIIAPHQVSRVARFGEEFEADVARDSGAIEETADFIFTLWSPDAIIGRAEHEKSGIVNMKIAKSRHGGRGQQIPLQFAPLTLALVPPEDPLRDRARREIQYEQQRDTWETALWRHRTGVDGPVRPVVVNKPAPPRPEKVESVSLLEDEF